MPLITLLNPSRALLAISSVLAGYCLFRFYAYTSGNQFVVPYLLAAGGLLAMADSAWRRIFTAAAREEREGAADIGAGALSTTAAFFIAVFTTLAGLMCAMTGGFNSFRAAGAAIVIMLARSLLFRTTEILSPLLGGITAGMFFLLGMTAHPSFVEMLHIDETRFPVAFFTSYMIVVSVLAQVMDAPPRPRPEDGEPGDSSSSGVLATHDDTVDHVVVWLGGGVLALIPLALAWSMSLRWLSWLLLGLLSLSLILKLIPAGVHRTRRDLKAFVESAFRGGALLNAGSVAGLGEYRLRELYDGWTLTVPGQYELAAVAIIAFLAIPAWALRRSSPVD